MSKIMGGVLDFGQMSDDEFIRHNGFLSAPRAIELIDTLEEAQDKLGKLEEEQEGIKYELEEAQEKLVELDEQHKGAREELEAAGKELDDVRKELNRVCEGLAKVCEELEKARSELAKGLG